MLKRVLTEDEQALVRDERRLLGELREELARFGAGADEQATLARSIEQLDDLFLLVVVGEFNAGKSALINALLGQALLPEGVTPTTARITLLRYADREKSTPASEAQLLTLSAPVDLLREIHIVDTPGTNAIIREHEALTAGFVPRSDLVLFVTSADRPFTETERAFLQEIRDWGKKIVVVVNKVDILEEEAEVGEIVQFVAESSQRLLGLRPEVFPVSARSGLRGKRGDPGRWATSRLAPLERYIHATLDEVGRLKLKLLNPLGVAARLAERYGGIARNRLSLLDGDRRLLDTLGRQVSGYEQDLERDFGFRMAEVEKILLEMEGRGHEYFDEMLRLGRVFDLLNRSRVQRGFEEQVVADAPRDIERRVGELVDWLVEADFRQWQAVTAQLAERASSHADHVFQEPELTRFQTDRRRLLETAGRETQRVVDAYDRKREAAALADSARNAVAAAAAAGAGAVGLGTVVTMAASTAVADVTGMLMASLMAAIGFFIIPAKRRRAKAQMRQKVTTLRETLASALRSRFDHEIRQSARRIRDGFAPYARFVEAERDKLATAERAFSRLDGEFGQLKTRVAAL